MAKKPVIQGPSVDTDEEFLARLQKLAENWRWSNEFIGMIVRERWPRNYAKS